MELCIRGEHKGTFWQLHAILERVVFFDDSIQPGCISGSVSRHNFGADTPSFKERFKSMQEAEVSKLTFTYRIETHSLLDEAIQFGHRFDGTAIHLTMVTICQVNFFTEELNVFRTNGEFVKSVSQNLRPN